MDEQDNKNADQPRRRLITRRRLLKAAGVTAAAGAAGTGGFLFYDHRERFGRSAERVIVDHRVALPPLLPPMVIARGADAARNTRAAIESLGGMEQFINANDIVVVKPNIGFNRTPEQAANTHPDVVAEIVRLCRAVGPKRLIVADCPMRRSRRAFERSGIFKAATETGAEISMPETGRYHTVEISPRLGTWDVLEPFVIATKVINVPVAKHHNLTGVTAGLKNWIGITGKLRLMFHDSLQQSIAELAALMRPTLTVVDATRVLMRGGPVGGSLDDVMTMNTVAAGVDPVALDAWAFSLFNLSREQLPENLFLAEKMGLGQIDFAALNPVEVMAG